MRASSTKRSAVPRGRVEADDAPLTAAELRTARPANIAIPGILADLARARGRPRGQTKTQVTLRLDTDVLARLRASGPGWQGRVNAVLKSAMGLGG